MTLTDEFADLADEMMAGEFGAEARLYREENQYDPETDTSSLFKVVVKCRAALGLRRVMAGNGVLLTETVATLTAMPHIGDTLSIGLRDHRVTSVEEIAPHGEAIIWKAVLA